MNKERYTAFMGYRQIASGGLKEVLAAAKSLIDSKEGTVHHEENILIFSHQTGRQVDFDFRGPLESVLSKAIPDSLDANHASETKPGKGRPRLGVISGEVTLLPRHWDWLSSQPGKASATIRRLVDEARMKEKSDPKKRADILSSILWSLAGNCEDFEEATRSLFRLDFTGLYSYTDAWPGDLPAFIREWFRDFPIPQ